MNHRTRAVVTVLASLMGVFFECAVAWAMTPAEFVGRLEATGVWHWTNRTQEMQIVQDYDGSRWEQTLLSYERWTDGGEYGQLTVMLSPPAMARTRILGLFLTTGDNLRWLYADAVGRARRLPPARVEGFLGNVFAGMSALQRLPFVLRRNPPMSLETHDDTYFLTIPAGSDADGNGNGMRLKFRTAQLLLEELTVTDSGGAAIYKVRLGEYGTIQGIPTPMSFRIVMPDAERRTHIRASHVAYGTSLNEELFQVPTFGRVYLATPPPTSAHEKEL